MNCFPTRHVAAILALILSLAVPAISKADADAYATLPYLRLSPVPASRHVTLKLPATEAATLTAAVLDHAGRTVATLPVVNGRISLETLAPGAYYLMVKGERTYRASLIKA